MQVTALWVHNPIAVLKTATTGQRTAAKYSNAPSQQLSIAVMHIHSDLGRESSAQNRR